MQGEHRLSDQVAETILSQITIEKRFQPGDQLPNENIFSEELGVSRTTLREAFRILAAKNVVEIRRGKGTFVKESFHEETLDTLSPLCTIPVTLADLYEMRLIFEPEAAYFATLRASEGEMLRILELGEKIEQKRQCGDSTTDAELIFHKAIAKATHNEFLYQLVPVIQEAIQKGIVLAQQEQTNLSLAVDAHQTILHFMQNRNADGAKYAMKIHILHVMEQLNLHKPESNPLAISEKRNIR